MNTENSKTTLNEEENSSQISSFGGYEYKHRYEKLMQTKTEEAPSVRITAVVAFAMFFTVVVVALACLLIINIIITAPKKSYAEVVHGSDSMSGAKDTLAAGTVNENADLAGRNVTVSVYAGNDEMSGVFVTSDGYIVTGGSPCLDAENIFVCISGKKHTAKVIGVNTSRNIAVLKVDSVSNAAADFGHGERIKIGESVFVAYNSQSGYRVSSGEVSSVDGASISVDGIGFENAMYGAAVMDKNGMVLGIITHGSKNSLCAVPSSFAISTIRQYVKDAIEITSEDISKIEWLGVSVIKITDDESERFGLPGGVMVLKTERASVAEHVGLLPSDIIIGVESFAVDSAEELNDVMARYSGQTVSLLVYRNERFVNVDLDVDN